MVSGDSKTFHGISGIINSIIYGNYTVYTGGSEEGQVRELAE